MKKILTLNKISPVGLSRFDANSYVVVFNANVTKGIQAGVFSTYVTMIIFTALAVLFILMVKIPKAPKAEG